MDYPAISIESYFSTEARLVDYQLVINIRDILHKLFPSLTPEEVTPMLDNPNIVIVSMLMYLHQNAARPVLSDGKILTAPNQAVVSTGQLGRGKPLRIEATPMLEYNLGFNIYTEDDTNFPVKQIVTP